MPIIKKEIIHISISLILIALLYGLSTAQRIEQPFMEKATVEKDMTFGSQTILETCWTKKELQGTPNDKISKKLKISDYAPPLKKIPDFAHPPLVPERENSIRHVIPYHEKKIVALTFDLCELAKEVSGYDSEIVNYLRANSVKATFFAGGKWMRSHPDKTLQLMTDPLFEIGSHAWTHGNLMVLKAIHVREQILWTQAQYELLRGELLKKSCVQNADVREIEKIPPAIMIFRFPYGTCNSVALNMLAQYGLPAIQWDVVTGDPAPGQTAKGISRTILSQTKPGSIIVCHANGRGHGTAQALPLFIPELRKKGYRFVTVSELLDMGEIVSSKKCYELKPGDNLRYDKKTRTKK